MAKNCLVTKLNGTVNAQLPVLGKMKFHVPYDANYQTDYSTISIGSSGSTTKVSTTGSFTIGGTNIEEYVLLPYTKASMINSNIVGGTEITIENYYDVIDLSLTEDIVAGIEKDSNIDSLMGMNLKRFMYRDNKNQNKSLDFLLKAKNLVALYVFTNFNDEALMSQVIKNNPNLVYVEKKNTTLIPMTEECLHLTLQEDYRGFIGNIEYLGSAVVRKDINSARDFGSLDALITRLRSTRTTGSIRLDYLNFTENITIGDKTAKAFCTEQGITSSTGLYVTWDASTISVTNTKPQDYTEPTSKINSNEINNLVYAH